MLAVKWMCFVVVVHVPTCIEGLYDAVHINMRMIDTHSLVSSLYSPVWRKTTKHAVILDLLPIRILNFTQVRANIPVTQLLFGNDIN